MSLNPNGLADIRVMAGETDVHGCTLLDISGTIELQDITCDENAARSRFAGLSDDTISLTFIEDDDDAGQSIIRAAKPARSLISYVAWKGPTCHVFRAYVSKITSAGHVGEMVSRTVELVRTGTTWSISASLFCRLIFSHKNNSQYLVVC